METGKPGLASAPAHNNLVTAQMEKRMEIQTPLMALYIPAVPALPGLPYSQPTSAAAAQERTAVHVAVPPAHSKDTLPFVTLHFSGSLQPQRGLSLAAASPAPRPKSAGKHVCPHCGRDCLKPSVLEKHLRCHTGERPFPCTTCGISFKTQSNLYKHKRTQAHARLSSESDQSLPSSLDSRSSSRETCSSSMSLDEHQEESGSADNDVALPGPEVTCSDGTATMGFSKSHASVSANPQAEDPALRTDASKSLHRHIPLQRQEATLFSKQWESSVSKGKSQSHESTDSGFSESSDLYQCSVSVLPDHGQDCPAGSTKEHLEETAKTTSPVKEAFEEAKAIARQQEKMTLEKRISQLISENTAVVEDKQLENVRPRKTVLSKQGSIDLPMPYVYKDSFHFDMRISKAPSVGFQRSRKPDFYSSVPTQQSTTSPPEHAPLMRSHSLPFSVALLPPEAKTQSLSQSDYVSLVGRGSSGQMNPTGFGVKPANHQPSTHRPLVRQAAVDCNHATDSLCKNSSAEEAGTGAMCCDGDGGEICGEPGNRKFRRRKAQKFAYNKWYMYGGGTFKRLYNTEAGGKESGIKGRKGPTNPDQQLVQGLHKQPSGVHQERVTTPDPTIRFTSSSAPQVDALAKLSFASTLDFHLKTTQVYTSCSSLKNPFRRNLSLSALPSPVSEPGCTAKSVGPTAAGGQGQPSESAPSHFSSKLCELQIPSDRKKQRTDEKIGCPLEMDTDQIPIAPPSHSATGSALHPRTAFKGAVIPCVISAQSLTVIAPSLTSTPSTTETSFLPKYQLKLPNAAESDPSQAVDITDEVPVGFGVSSSSLPCAEAISLPPHTMQKCSNSKKTRATISTQSQRSLPRTVTTLCKAESSGEGECATTRPGDVVPRQSAATITATCLRENRQESRCTTVQPPKHEERLSPVHSAGRAAAVVASVPITPSAATGSHQPDHSLLPLPNAHIRLSPTSGQSTLVCRSSHTSVDTSVVSTCSLHCDQKLLSAQNVFHVRTGDLQICLQIISDEQLALIEPQIERQANSDSSQTPCTEAPQLSQDSAQNSRDVKRRNRADSNHQQTGGQKDLDGGNSGPPVSKRMLTPLAMQLKVPESVTSLAESDHWERSTTCADSQVPEALGQSQSQTYVHVNTVTETPKSLMDAATTEASRDAVFSIGSRQTSVEEQALSQKNATRLEDKSGVWSQTSFIQQIPSAKSPAFNTLDQSSPIGVKERIANKAKNQEATCHFAMTEVKSTMSLSANNHPSLPVRLQLQPSTTCALKPSASSYPISKYRAAKLLRPQESVNCSDSSECVLPPTHNSSEHFKHGANQSPVVAALPSNDRFQKDPRDSVTSAQEKSTVNNSHVIPLPSASQVKRPTYVPAVATSSQSPTAGNYTFWRYRQTDGRFHQLQSTSYQSNHLLKFSRLDYKAEWAEYRLWVLSHW